MRFPIALFLLTILCCRLHAQNVGVGTTTPDASSILELSSVTKGFLPPQMTAAEKMAIAIPKPGLMVYQTDGNKGMYIYINGTWLLSGGNFVDLTSNQTINGVKTFVNDIYADGVRVGVGNGNVATNTIVGYNALNSNSSGDGNIGVGYQSLFKNTLGSGNTAVGFAAQYTNLNGDGNTSLGRATLYNNLGSGNTALGGFSLYENTSGVNNVALGTNALRWNTNHSNIVAVGDYALYHNGIGSINFTGQGDGNTAVGSKSLFENNIGQQNTAIGFQSLMSNTSGSHNSAFGHSALNFNIQGLQNTAVGNHSLYKNTIGGNNTANGFNALNKSLDGDHNSAFGSESLIENTTGNYNTAIGSKALTSTTGGIGNTGLGYLATVVSQNQVNATAIGYLSYVVCDNCLVLGSVKGLNGSNTSVKVGIGTAIPSADLHIKQSNETYPLNGGGLSLERFTNGNHWDIGIDLSDDLNFTYNNLAKSYIRDSDGEYIKVSDRRMKKDITPIAAVLPSIMALQAKTYHYLDNKIDAPLSYGFIAQDVEAIFPDFVSTKGDDNMKAVAYQNFNVVAIKAIQEQQNIILSQQSKMDAMQDAINKTNEEVNLLKTQLAKILSRDVNK
jgi:trimeric autotransporter adhesin